MTSETGLTVVEAAKPITTGAALQQLLTNRQDRLEAALDGTGISAGRFVAGVVQAVAKNNDLLKCTRESVLLACLESAQIGLEPTGLLNQAWLVPYKTTARLMIGYAGYITLLDRSRSYDFIEANLVYEHDEFWWKKGTEPLIHHVPAPAGERGKIGHANGGGYWVAWKKGSARPQFDVMSMAEMDKRRKVSKRAEQDMWREWPEEMYRKTVLRWGQKSMPMTPIIQRALAYEQQTDQMEDEAPRPEQDQSRRRSLLDRIQNGVPEGTERPSEAPEAAEGTNARPDAEAGVVAGEQPGGPTSGGQPVDSNEGLPG